MTNAEYEELELVYLIFKNTGEEIEFFDNHEGDPDDLAEDTDKEGEAADAADLLRLSCTTWAALVEETEKEPKRRSQTIKNNSGTPTWKRNTLGERTTPWLPGFGRSRGPDSG